MRGGRRGRPAPLRRFMHRFREERAQPSQLACTAISASLLGKADERDFREHQSGKAAQRQPALALAAETEDNHCRCRLLTHNANVDTLKLHLQAAGLVCIKAAFESPIFCYSVLHSSKVAAAFSPRPRAYAVLQPAQRRQKRKSNPSRARESNS